jgi:hypothetical protein
MLLRRAPAMELEMELENGQAGVSATGRSTLNALRNGS